MTAIVNVDANVSSRINLMRLLLIAGIVFVHIPYDPQRSPYLGNYGTVDWLRVYLGDSLFRIGVPCLSAISGYLLFRRGLSQFDYRRVLGSKAVTVLLPFMLWNSAFLILVYAAQRNGVAVGYLPDVAGAPSHELASLAFAVQDWPINLPLYFLRDLLLCIALSPLLGQLVMRFPRLTLALFLAYTVLPVPNLIFLKKSILFGFSLGIYASLHQVDIKRLDDHAMPITLAIGAASLLLAAGLYTTGPEYPQWLEMLRSLTAIAGILGAWALSSFLVRTRFGNRLASGDGLSFWIFCGHYPLLILLWMAWNRTGSTSYPLFYLAAPLLTLVFLITTHGLVKRATPGLHAVLTGNRTGRARQHSYQPREAVASRSEYSS